MYSSPLEHRYITFVLFLFSFVIYFMFSIDEVFASFSGTISYYRSSSLVQSSDNVTTLDAYYGWTESQVTTNIKTTALNNVTITMKTHYKILGANQGNASGINNTTEMFAYSNGQAINITSYCYSSSSNLLPTNLHTDITFDNTVVCEFNLPYSFDKFRVNWYWRNSTAFLGKSGSNIRLDSISVTNTPTGATNQDIIDNQNRNQYETDKRLDELNKNQQETNNKLDDINDTLTDGSVDTDSFGNDFSNFGNSVASNSNISDMVLLPVTLWVQIATSTSSTCKPFNLGSLYGTNLTMECINPETYLGKPLWSVIDILCCGLLAYIIAKSMVRIFEKLSQLEEGGYID